jgi:hypothetical protein
MSNPDGQAEDYNRYEAQTDEPVDLVVECGDCYCCRAYECGWGRCIGTGCVCTEG